VKSPELEDFYREQYGQLVATVGTYCGDFHVAEEAAQEALTRASERWADVSRMEAPGPWVQRVAINLVSSHYRKRRTERLLRDRLARPHEWSSDPDPTIHLELMRTLEILPTRQRAAVALRYLLDWSVADVARALDTNENTVKSLAHRGTKRLREHLEETDKQSTLRLRTVVTGVIALVATAVAAFGVLTRAADRDVVYIEPAPVVDDYGAPTPPPEGGAHLTAVVNGDEPHDVELHAVRPGFPTGEIVEGDMYLNVRFLDGRNSLLIRGHAPERETATGDEMLLRFRIDGTTYVSANGECAVTLSRFTNPFDRDPDHTQGFINCTDLISTSGSSYVSLRGAFLLPHEEGD
jgi:RNA polymerase sigma-70 factor, ECF subfamily